MTDEQDESPSEAGASHATDGTVDGGGLLTDRRTRADAN